MQVLIDHERIQQIADQAAHNAVARLYATPSTQPVMVVKSQAELDAEFAARMAHVPTLLPQPAAKTGTWKKVVGWTVGIAAVAGGAYVGYEKYKNG